MTAQPKYPLTIAGGGSSGKSGSRGSSGGTEAPNSLKSKQVARVIDLISEGPISGPVNGPRGVFFDGVQLVSDSGAANFTNWSVAGNIGWPAQPVLPGFAAQQSETAVNLQLTTANPLTRTITDPNADRVRITVSTPALQVTNTSNGNITGTYIDFQIWIQSDGGGYQLLANHQINGKTNTTYQRSLTFNLIGNPPWDIRLVRYTPDSTTLNVQNDLFWDSYTTIIDARINYTLSAVCGVTIDAEQFQAIPKRVYDIKGLHMSIPSNYDPEDRTYTGVWDGTFKFAWTNNPAWVFMDLVVNARYGLGNFINAGQVDKWALYRIAQWCDGLVPNGRGGWEPRFLCNTVINTQQEAFDLVNSLASVFRGEAFWAGGQMVPFADMPADPVAQYTNANVIDGTFSYSGADIRSRHNMAQVKWNDPSNLGEPRIAIVEDQEGISLYGIQKTDVIAIGCTSESQALRAGKWVLFSETYEAETVNFSCGLATAWSRPGDIIQIADVNISGKRRGGRVAAGSTAERVYFDAPYGAFTTGGAAYLSCIIGEGVVQTRQIQGGDVAQTYLNVVEPFTAAPLPDTVFVIAEPGDLELTLWRVIAARQTDKDRYEVTALRHHPDKWAYIERNLALSTPDVSDIGAIPPISNLNAKDYLVALSSISVGVRMLISWQGLAPSFELAYRPVNGPWIRLRTDQVAHDVEAVEGVYDIWVTPISSLGRRGSTTKIRYTVVGRTAPPADPRNFRVQAVQGVAMFQWAPATELDVIVGGSYEMRYSPRLTGVSWSSSNTIVTSIPGTATTTELPWRSGTYLLRTRDILGLFSRNAALIVTSGPDENFRPFMRICEEPAWIGNKENTVIQEPQDWLVIASAQGGLWDDQTTLIDTWTDVDVLPVGPSGPAPNAGIYYFFNRIDMGGVFPVRLTVDMLAFPFIEGDAFVDDRPGLVDDWQDFDNAGDDAEGMVNIEVRQTDDDPASPTARWSNWKTFLSGEYSGRAFEFRATLAAPAGQNIAIEQLCILADISAKVDHGSDVVWEPTFMDIVFDIKFFLIPSISIAIQEGVVGDTFRITNKTRQGFRLELLDASGAPISGVRTFDWTANGY